MDKSTELVEPKSVDLATLSALAGDVSSEYLLQRVRERGHPFVRISHGYVFQHLIDGTPTVGELAQRLGVTQQAASKAVVELEQLGYIVRQGDSVDNRVRRVTLTPAGREVVEAGRDARAVLESRLRELVGPDDLTAAKRAIAVLLDEVGGIEAVRGRRVRARSSE